MRRTLEAGLSAALPRPEDAERPDRFFFEAVSYVLLVIPSI
jgi:hypothetical protein